MKKKIVRKEGRGEGIFKEKKERGTKERANTE